MTAASASPQRESEARTTASQLIRVIFKLMRQRLQQVSAMDAERCLADLKSGATRVQIVFNVATGETEIDYAQRSPAP
jgi:hypothetical protein